MFQYKYKNWKLSVKNHILWLALWRKIYEKEKVHSSSQKKNYSVMFGPLSINSNNLNTDNENIDFTIVYEQ